MDPSPKEETENIQLPIRDHRVESLRGRTGAWLLDRRPKMKEIMCWKSLPVPCERFSSLLIFVRDDYSCFCVFERNVN
jgi:hypothetical protein